MNINSAPGVVVIVLNAWDSKWPIGKDRPVSNVVDATLSALNDPSWLAKGSDEVKPVP
jgi:hypothetical protein